MSRAIARRHAAPINRLPMPNAAQRAYWDKRCRARARDNARAAILAAILFYGSLIAYGALTVAHHWHVV